MAAKINLKNATIIVLIAAASGILIASLVLNAMREYIDVRYVEFCIVPICLAIAALKLKESKTDGIILCLALAFTIAADYFMVLLQTDYELSLAFFACAQICYCIRIQLLRRSKKYTAISLGVRAAVCIIICAAAATLIKGSELLAILAAFYFINLVANTAEVFSLLRRDKGCLLFALGLFLFIGCDICVGLNSAYMVGIYISSDGYYALGLLIWIFYMPSQVLLGLSGGFLAAHGKD